MASSLIHVPNKPRDWLGHPFHFHAKVHDKTSRRKTFWKWEGCWWQFLCQHFCNLIVRGCRRAQTPRYTFPFARRVQFSNRTLRRRWNFHAKILSCRLPDIFLAELKIRGISDSLISHPPLLPSLLGNVVLGWVIHNVLGKDIYECSPLECSTFEAIQSSD